MRRPLAVVTGVDPAAMDGALLGLSWDLPDAVVVRHTIDPVSQVLTRVVSDATGVLEHHQITLEHACVSCALREDILPTLERLAREGRWSNLVAGLPIGTEASHLASVLARDSRLARLLSLSAVVAAVRAEDLVEDLLADHLLRERGLHTNPWDDRGVGEVACAQIEFADVVLVDDDPGAEALDLLRALANPATQIVVGAEQLDAAAVVAGRHQPARTASWVAAELGAPLPDLGTSHAWRVDLSTPRPFHPDRLLDQIERLGTGAFRSRGCFWVPTRPGVLCEWGGSGGQVSIGTVGTFGRRVPMTRLIFTGLGAAPTDLCVAFEELLLAPGEALLDRPSWQVAEDGLEPWLGEIHDVA